MNQISADYVHQLLRIKTLPATDLSSSHIAVWKNLASSIWKFRSPFFSPGYTRLIADCVDNVMVGLLFKSNELAGIFPYEEFAIGQGRPVGSVFSDYQGVIEQPNITWTVETLLDGARLDTWRYDHVLASQPQWTSFHQIYDVSWSIDLSKGFDVYEVNLQTAKRGVMADVRRKRRMLEREIAPLSFTPHATDHGLLDELLAWKSAQWELSGWSGRFKSSWEQQLMHKLLKISEPNFAGMFSILWGGNKPIAMHLGMRSKYVWHYWTTAYDPAFARYSPGLLMLVEMLRYAPNLGILELDLGKEDFDYKRRLHTHVIPLAEGVAFTNTIKSL